MWSGRQAAGTIFTSFRYEYESVDVPCFHFSIQNLIYLLIDLIPSNETLKTLVILAIYIVIAQQKALLTLVLIKRVATTLALGVNFQPKSLRWKTNSFTSVVLIDCPSSRFNALTQQRVEGPSLFAFSSIFTRVLFLCRCTRCIHIYHHRKNATLSFRNGNYVFF